MLENFNALVLLFPAAIVMAIVVYFRRASRPYLLRKLATELGLSYEREDPSPLKEFAFLRCIHTGEPIARKARNVMVGPTKSGSHTLVFDYFGTPHAGSLIGAEQSTRFIVHHQGDFPRLIIRPETLTDKILQKKGYKDIDFDSLEFSDAFAIHSKDNRFAYAFCTPQIMDLLLNHPGIHLEVCKSAICIHTHELVPISDIEPALGLIAQIASKVPAYLYEK